MMRAALVLAAGVLLLASPAAAQRQTAFEPADLRREATIAEPVFTPDGATVIYSVEAEGLGDVRQTDLWAAPWADGPPRRLTDTPTSSEWAPEVSADGRTIAYLSDAGEEGTQLWLLPTGGGTARRVGAVPGGIEAFSLSPDGRAAVVVAEVGVRVGTAEDDKAPIVIDRFQMRMDGRPWLDDRRRHLFRLDLTTGATTPLTIGDFDEDMPAWSPDGRWIAFVSRRCPEPDRHYCSDVYVMPSEGGQIRRISSFAGGDSDPDWEGGGPRWSPDSRRLVWLEGGDERLTWYTPFQLAVADIETRQVERPGRIDRWFYAPRWSPDGRSVLAMVEQDRDTWLARVDVASGAIDYLTEGARFASAFAVAADGRIAVVDGDVRAPATLNAVERGGRTRVLADHNPWVGQRRQAEVRDVSWVSDGVEIHGLLTLPPRWRQGDAPPPLIVRLHGGPVYQYSHEFMADWQVYAARGYAVLAPNPRGSSGRGEAFARAQMANWGGPDVIDVSAGIGWAIQNGFADPNRIGVGGWSYGGILTNYMIAQDSRIRAAVSGAGMANFLGGYGVDQYARDYELELGAPFENPDLWLRLSAPFFDAPRISAATLYLCAEADHNVPCAGSQQMFQALKSVGATTQLVIYPGESHGLTTPSHIEDRLRRHLEWYDRHLAARAAAPALQPEEAP